MRLRIHSRIECSSVNGPGKRVVIWTQGCSLRCKNCWNSETHDPKGGDSIEVAHLAQWIVDTVQTNPGLTGLTISGGEPVEQAPALLNLLAMVKTSMPSLSIGLFSGYSERELDQGSYWIPNALTAVAKQKLWQSIRSRLDFAVLGRYNHRRPSHHPLTSSANQRLRLYTQRYTLHDFDPQSVEVTIDAAGLTQITGFPVLGAPAAQ